MVKHCCWGDCRSDDRYMERESMQGVFFIAFPKPTTQPEKCRTWVSLCGRKNWGVSHVNKNTYICSKHFVGGNGPIADHPNPLPAAGTALDVSRATKRARPYPRSRSVAVNVKDAIDSKSQHITDMYHHNIQQEHAYAHNVLNSVDNNQQIQQLHLQEEHPYASNSGHRVDDFGKENQCKTLSRLDLDEDNSNHENNRLQCEQQSQTSLIFSNAEDHATKLPTKDACTQTEITMESLRNFPESSLLDEGRMRRHLITSDVTKDDSSSKFYTGLTIALMSLVFGWLKGKAENMSYWCGAETNHDKERASNYGRRRSLTLWEEFLLTLLRMRRGYDNTTLGNLFGISPSSVCRIFFSWIRLMSHELKFLVCWPSKEQCRKKLPKCFKFFPRTRCVIDCTEFFIQKPSMPSSQRITWSAYKHHNTLKVLVGISPRGSFSFVSGVFTGSISDKKIVMQSGFLNKIEHGDDIMADRGFLIRGELALRGATLNMPPFAMGRQLCKKATTNTRRIAHARIHVERAIGRLKNFTLLQGVLSLKLRNVVDDIIQVCAALCNLDRQLVNKCVIDMEYCS